MSILFITNLLLVTAIKFLIGYEFRKNCRQKTASQHPYINIIFSNRARQNSKQTNLQTINFTRKKWICVTTDNIVLQNCIWFIRDKFIEKTRE